MARSRSFGMERCCKPATFSNLGGMGFDNEWLTCSSLALTKSHRAGFYTRAFNFLLTRIIETGAFWHLSASLGFPETLSF